MDYAITNRRMRAIDPPGSTRLLAENMWASWLEAICFAPMLTDRPSDETRNESIRHAMMRQVMAIQPYSSRAFIDQLAAASKDI